MKWIETNPYKFVVKFITIVTVLSKVQTNNIFILLVIALSCGFVLDVLYHVVEFLWKDNEQKNP